MCRIQGVSYRITCCILVCLRYDPRLFYCKKHLVIDPETLRYHKTLALPKNFHQKPVSERLIQTKLSFFVRTPPDPGRWSERLLVRKCSFFCLFVCLDHWSENTDRFFLPKKVFSFTLAEKVLVSSPSCTAGRFLPICLCRTSFINAYLFRVRRVREGSKIIGTQNRRQAKIEIFRPRPLPYLSRIV